MKKVNESIYRSPKWLRNILDYEISTGEDIKGEPSARMKKEMKEKEEYERQQAEHRRKQDERRRKQDEKDYEDRLFIEIFRVINEYIKKYYTICTVVETPQNISISKDKLTYKKSDFQFEVTLHYKTSNRQMYFHYVIKYGNRNFDRTFASNSNYETLAFAKFIVTYILGSKQQQQQQQQQRSSYRRQSNYDYYGRGNTENKTRKEPPKNESDPVKNRQRRLDLLKITLKSYETELANMPANHPDRQQKENEINVIKGRIKAMQEPRNESLRHLMSFRIFENQYNPAKDDYVTVIYALTGEPVPAQIKKVFPNNTYLVSFNVDGSTVKGAPDATIRNSDIISPYKNIRTPVGSGFISANTNFQVRNTTNVNQVSNDMYL